MYALLLNFHLRTTEDTLSSLQTWSLLSGQQFESHSGCENLNAYIPPKVTCFQNMRPCTLDCSFALPHWGQLKKEQDIQQK